MCINPHKHIILSLFTVHAWMCVCVRACVRVRVVCVTGEAVQPVDNN